jgi:hypothetical protein
MPWNVTRVFASGRMGFAVRDWNGHRDRPDTLRYPALRCFHADTGQGLGAAHQTGWTGVVANLVTRRYRTDIPAYWRKTLAERARADAAA